MEIAQTATDDTVRAEVLALLGRSQAWRSLPGDQRDDIARSMERVGRYLTRDPGWVDPSVPVRARALAEAEEKVDAVDATKQRLAEKPGQVGDGFVAGAAREGVSQFTRLVNEVDFPAFVSGLVKGVFNAVVDASIQQMKAYGEMLAATVKSLDQFTNDHVSDAQARDYLLSRYPSALTLETPADAPARLRRNSEGPEIDLGAEFGIGDGVDVDDEEGERALVQAARKELGRNNQQLMATMVLLGINRIVITNGKINAKVLFDVKTNDDASRRSRAEMHDNQTARSSASAGGFAVAPWGVSGGTTSSSSAHSTSVSSAVDDTSASKAELKASLSGDVQLAFKSETFPLERMLDPMGMAQLNDRARPGKAPPAPAAPSAATSPPAGAGR